ncbi:hypothetical protein BJ322DRAFT_844289 [Thelephora terrestris]|uniref:Uncharacterized protein n=1 Tax=Thelephora terrestris TaxID=56493 RepID=A0A9P6HD42_9AGAM|nr:hypothetical protein BJ322DRAFT_844289 [Thelephora terrestris]
MGMKPVEDVFSSASALLSTIRFLARVASSPLVSSSLNLLSPSSMAAGIDHSHVQFFWHSLRSLHHSKCLCCDGQDIKFPAHSSVQKINDQAREEIENWNSGALSSRLRWRGQHAAWCAPATKLHE